MTSSDATIPTILDIQHKALLLPGRPLFWTSHHLAEFYQTSPQRVVEQKRRNPRRFPSDFWLELRDDEVEVLVTQFAGPNRINRGVLIGFTKAGALALAGVLRTPVADAVSVQIVRAIVAMEEAAIRDANKMLGKFRSYAQARKPFARINEMAKAGMTVDEIRRTTGWPAHKVEALLDEARQLDMLDTVPAGFQPSLFGGNHNV